MLPALILAGGRARRLGGADKALVPLAGRPLLAHVRERLAGQAAPILVSANGDPARFARFNLEILPDTVAGYPGPLAGILAGFVLFIASELSNAMAEALVAPVWLAAWAPALIAVLLSLTLLLHTEDG